MIIFNNLLKGFWDTLDFLSKMRVSKISIHKKKRRRKKLHVGIPVRRITLNFNKKSKTRKSCRVTSELIVVIVFVLSPDGI